MKNSFKKLICLLLAVIFAVVPAGKIMAEENSPKKSPQSLVTTIYNSSKTSRAFTWYTDSDVSESVVQFVTEEIYLKNGDLAFTNMDVPKIYGTCYSLQIDENKNYRNIHRVNLENLEPGTKYYYRAGGNGFWSNVFSFTTENENTDSFTFFSVTDTQASSVGNLQSYKNYSKILGYATELYPDSAFILHSGDMIQNNYLSHYDKVFELTQTFSASLPVMLAAGNHELEKDSFDYVSGLDNINSHYLFPDNGPENSRSTIYSFDYGDAHFVILDSSRTISYPEQIRWLKKDISASDKTWKILSIHTGPYNNYGKGSDILIKAIDELEIDLVIFGHNHTFLRSNPIKNGVTDSSVVRYEFFDSEGTVYYSSGCAGAAAGAGGTSDNQTENPQKMAKTYFSVLDYNAARSPLFGAITVNNDSITVKTYALSEKKLVDEFTILKFVPEVADINLDGSVNVFDAYYARLVAAKLIKPTEEQLSVGDVDLDGKITAIDANIIRKYAVGIITELPVTQTK